MGIRNISKSLAGVEDLLLDNQTHTQTRNGSSVDITGIHAGELPYYPSGTGAVERTIGEKLGEVVSVKDFGAVGDGVTDDTDAIQAAVDSLANAGSVYLPEGDYLVSRSLSITKHGITLRGAGRLTTRIISETDDEVVYFKFAVAGTLVYYCGLRDLTIRSTHGSPASPGLRVQQHSNFHMDNVHIEGFLIGLLCQGIAQSNFSNFSISAYGYTGSTVAGTGLIELRQDSSASATDETNWTTNFSNFILGGADKSYSLIRIEACDAINFANGYCGGTSGTSGYAVSFDREDSSDPTPLAAVNFTNIYFDKAASSTEPMACIFFPAYSVNQEQSVAIKINGCTINGYTDAVKLGMEVRNFTISDCSIINCVGSGVYIQGIADKSEIIIANNDFRNIGSNGSSYGVYAANCGNLIIADNHFTSVSGTSTFAIKTFNTITGLSITGNHFKNCTSDTLHGATVTEKTAIANNVTDSTDYIVSSASTITLAPLFDFFTVIGTTNVTSIAASWKGREVILLVSDATGFDFVDGSNLRLAGNFSANSGDILKLVCDGTSWFEVSRSVN